MGGEAHQDLPSVLEEPGHGQLARPSPPKWDSRARASSPSFSIDANSGTKSSPSPGSQLIDALPPTATRTESTLFPDGGHITDLKEARDLLYKLQRPGIAPEHVYVVDWKPRQLALFHNRGCLHSITGAFAVRFVRMLSVPDQKRDVNLSFPIPA